MSEYLTVKSLFQEYRVDFEKNVEEEIRKLISENTVHIILDEKVYRLQKGRLGDLSGARSITEIEAIEQNKDIETVRETAVNLLENSVTKKDLLLVIGGGIIQDICAFMAHVLMRGLRWYFIPTTLLAMCDSCIGSKCGINMGGFKNQLGVFCPPSDVLIDTAFLETLEKLDILSGIGEILKVHLIAGEQDFANLERDYTKIVNDYSVLKKYIFRSLEIKKSIVEKDEFDIDYRHILNYGHTFGHAIEAYTDNFVPHGIGVNIGMEIANYISVAKGFLTQAEFERISNLLRTNIPYNNLNFGESERLMKALSKDKKSDGKSVNAILCSGTGKIFKHKVEIDDNFAELIQSYTQQYNSTFGGKA